MTAVKFRRCPQRNQRGGEESHGRAREVTLSPDDVSGDLAELYGYVNRSLPDADLNGFVDALATRIASFDKQTIMDTKRFVNILVCRLISKSNPGGMLTLLR